MATHATPPTVHKKSRRRSLEDPPSSAEEPAAEASLRRPRPTDDRPVRVATAATAMPLLPIPAAAAAAASSSAAPAAAPSSEAGDEPPQQRSRAGSGAAAAAGAAAQRPGRGAAAAAAPTEASQQQAYRRQLAHALRQCALADRREARDKLAREPRRLGTSTKDLYQDRHQMNWEGGTEAEHIEAMKNKISLQKADVERTKKELMAARNRQQPRPGAPGEGARPMTQDEADEEIWEKRELCNTKLEAIRREELELTQRERRLARERQEHLRLRDAVNVEDKVCFDSFPMLQDRYQLLRVTGHLPPSRTTRVFSAYDLADNRHCCVRLHQLPGPTSEHEVRLRDVTAECESIRAVTRDRHPGLLQLLDFFRHDGTAGGEYRFATVWESCGADNTLEAYLLRNGPLPEREARGITLQLLSAVRYAESRSMRLERADLKIQHIGFTGGEVKVAVTTLPCLRDRAPPAGLAGSPTEAYRRLGSDHLAAVDSQDPSAEGEDDPVAEVKLQLWSLLFAMLYGKLRSGAAPHEAPHEAPPLPDQPRVTTDCRDFLSRLHNRDRRVKLQDLYNDPFITGGKRPRTA